MLESNETVVLSPRLRDGRKSSVLIAIGFGILPIALSCQRNSAPADDIKVAFASAAAPPDPAGIAFADVTRERGISFTFPEQPRPMRTPEAFGCGCALFDYDNDGWIDVFLAADPHPVIYRNLSGRRFAEVTSETRLSNCQANDWIGCAVGDYDGDGWLDLLLTGFHRLALLRNAGGTGFEEVTEQVGLDPLNRGHWGASSGWMDLDGDGDLDLVILNYVVFGPESKQYCELKAGVLSGCPPTAYLPEFGEIWRNDGERGFELIDGETAGMNSTHGVALVLAFTDYDNDNRMDFYIGNDGTRAELMRNLGEMKFENVGEMSGLSVNHKSAPMAAMGADWADYNRDGRLDLTVTNFQNKGFAIYRNEGSGFFLETGHLMGVAAATYNLLGFGAKWLDMDNDRWPDICYVNGHVYDNASEIEGDVKFRQPIALFRNLEGKRFVDLAPVLGGELSRPIVGRGSATGDFNNDGRTDVLAVDFEGPPILLENRSRTPFHWVSLDLRSSAPNTFAYGARAMGYAGDEVWAAEVSPASSYLSSSDPRIHWGLGPFERLQKLVIRWPGGKVQVFEDVAADRFLRITEDGDIESRPSGKSDKSDQGAVIQ